MDLTTILTWIFVGAVAGILADILVKGIRMGLIGKILVGIAGAFVGGWLFGVLNISIGTGLVNAIIAAFVGAVILLLILRALR